MQDLSVNPGQSPVNRNSFGIFSARRAGLAVAGQPMSGPFRPACNLFGSGAGRIEFDPDRAQERGINAVKGTSLLDSLNRKEIPTMMMAGEVDYGKGKITLSTDKANHPGMVFYSLDNGLTDEKNNVQLALDKVFESLRVISPTGSAFSLPGLAPAY